MTVASLNHGATAGALPSRRPRPIPARISLLHGALFLTILISAFVFIEPSPYEAAAGILGFMCIVARVGVDRKLLPLIVLLVLWNAGGLVALMPVVNEEKTVQFAAVSVFLALTAVIYACLFTQDCTRRLALLCHAYLIAGTVVSIVGIVGYFDAFPGAAKLFTLSGRALGTFKDPNVFGPYLIFPMLLLLQRILIDKIHVPSLVPLFIMLLGLFLSFSRGAWFHFGLSAAVMVGLIFFTTTDMRKRSRLVLMVVIALGVCSALILLLLSFSAVGDMFTERAKLIQPYDAGTNLGRFKLQELAVDSVLTNPLGMGPFAFSAEYGTQQHNVYLQAFLVYGWLGGFSYIVLVLVTLALGLRTVFVTTPWRPVMIVCVATFVGAVAEGFVIDTDHWRHFFLLLGMIWGLGVATLNFVREAPQRPPMRARVMHHAQRLPQRWQDQVLARKRWRGPRER